MRGVEGKTGKRRFGFSYALLALAVVTYLGTWAYSSYAAEWRAKAQTPRIDPILKIIKDLRQYQRIKATFPQSFTDVETARSEEHTSELQSHSFISYAVC